ncbi:hypothetical protein [Variovorax terrae]|uniref:DUF4386 domain-containing protein n=1 Tax=Variovorax terrae TaxID=2923278 RepID=A0A9X2AQA6_9BURK|nr:hypothetical protein [Variovorax terrae]MCJ0762966.1 hypothetical protein [Variovorax terrae]
MNLPLSIEPGRAGDPRFGPTAAALLGAGALGLIATSICYALAGPAAALPGGAGNLELARAATAPVAGWMRAAGLIGMPSDVLLAVGALMMAFMKRGEGAGLAMAGWLALAIAGTLFVIVDAMVALVLPPLAALEHGEAAYSGLRSLFDGLFAIGAWTTGLGALAAAGSARWPEYRRRGVLWLMRAAGAVCVAANTAYLLGLPGSRLIGPGIALEAVALLALSIALLRSPPPYTRASIG